MGGDQADRQGGGSAVRAILALLAIDGVAAVALSGGAASPVLGPVIIASTALVAVSGLALVRRRAAARRTAARRTAAQATAARPAADAAYGSLGLLSAPLAASRLAAEVERARYADRPLSVLRVGIDIAEAGLDEIDRDRALRAAARAVESIGHPLAVAFAMDEGDLGAILPETAAADADELLVALTHAIESAPVTIGSRRRRVPLGHLAIVRVGRSTYWRDGSDAATLMAAATPRPQAILRWVRPAPRVAPGVPATPAVAAPGSPAASAAPSAALGPAPEPVAVRRS